MRELKQHKIAKEKEIGGNTFYIRPFPAFVAANISGELVGILAPALAGVVPLLAAGGETDVMSLDFGSFSGAMSALSGDKVTAILNKLLIKHGNISVKLEGETEPEPLDTDLANDVFCGSTQDMFVLAYEVIDANFAGFFEKIGRQFGARKVSDTAKTSE